MGGGGGVSSIFDFDNFIDYSICTLFDETCNTQKHYELNIVNQ